MRTHIGIEGNKKADHGVEFELYLEEFSHAPHIITEEGLRASGRASCALARIDVGFGQRKRQWNHHSLATYTSL